jgi:hypothetical protein
MLSNWQLSTLAQISTLSSSLFFPAMVNFCVCEYRNSAPVWNDIENTEWLDLLRLFTAVKNLYLSKLISRRIGPVIQDITGAIITELLPALQNVFLEEFQPSEPVPEGIAQFISTRQLTNPVTISAWQTPGLIVAPLH